jgi:hypothetical protein
MYLKQNGFSTRPALAVLHLQCGAAAMTIAANRVHKAPQEQ